MILFGGRYKFYIVFNGVWGEEGILLCGGVRFDGEGKEVVVVIFVVGGWEGCGREVVDWIFVCFYGVGEGGSF